MMIKTSNNNKKLRNQWFKDPRKFSRSQLLIFAAVFAVIGGYFIYKSFAATPSVANLWVDTSGGTCSRQSTAGSYSDSTACASIDAAWDNCQPGDVIVIKAGTYGAQTISGNKSSPGCDVIGENTVTTGILATNGAYLTIENITVDAGPNHASGGWSAGANNVTLKNVRLHGPYVSASVSGVNNVQWLGGELGEAGKVGGKRKIDCVSTGDSEPVQMSSVSNIVFDGIHFYPQDADTTPVSCSSNGFHLEMIRMDGGTTFTTIKNSTFHNGDHSNTASIFITTPSSGSNLPHDLTFANNFFGSADNNSISMHSNVNVCQNIIFAYNTMTNGTGSLGCASASNLVYVGNIGARASYEECFGTHIKNVWQDDRTYTCGTDKVLVGTRGGEEKLGLGGTEGFYIQAGSPAIDAGESTYCSSVLGNKDHDGNTRPTGSTCDAGAIEYGATGGGGGGTPAPTVSLAANPASITSGSSSTLTWSSTNATSCSASGSWSGSKAISGTQSVSPTSTSVYNLSCSGAGGSANASATVTVTSGGGGGGGGSKSTGDLNGDGKVDISDLSILLSNYNTTNTIADVNGDGSVNIFDLSVLLTNYGSSSSGGTANIWLSSSGNDSTCVRGDNTKPCLTISKARSIAQCGDTVSVASGSYGSQSVSSGSSCPTNPVIFKVASGTASFGAITLNVAGIKLDGITSSSRINLNSSCNGCQVYNSTFPAFTSNGSDNNEFVGNNIGPSSPTCTYGNNFLWPGAQTNYADGWLIRGNTFHDFQCDNPHSEALYIASGASHGLIENNIFTNNGNTGHMFFTWCSDFGNGCVSYGQENIAPHDWCTRNNTFYDTWNAYYAIDSRQELENITSLRLYIDSDQSVTGPVIPPGAGGSGSNLAEFASPWTEWMLTPSCSDPRT